MPGTAFQVVHCSMLTSAALMSFKKTPGPPAAGSTNTIEPDSSLLYTSFSQQYDSARPLRQTAVHRRYGRIASVSPQTPSPVRVRCQLNSSKTAGSRRSHAHAVMTLQCCHKQPLKPTMRQLLLAWKLQSQATLGRMLLLSTLPALCAPWASRLLQLLPA